VYANSVDIVLGLIEIQFAISSEATKGDENERKGRRRADITVTATRKP
jgi:hypothetical protein